MSARQFEYVDVPLHRWRSWQATARLLGDHCYGLVLDLRAAERDPTRCTLERCAKTALMASRAVRRDLRDEAIQLAQDIHDVLH